jgi:hypothetical protein
LKFNISHLKQQSALINLLKEFSDIFANDSQPGTTHLVSHTIETGDAKPINQMPYRAGRREKQEIEKQIKELMKHKIIRPSKSPWASPVILISKKDETSRFCVDYRKLNSLTIRDVYPLPRINDLLSYLESQSFSQH